MYHAKKLNNSMGSKLEGASIVMSEAFGGHKVEIVGASLIKHLRHMQLSTSL